MAPFAGGAKNIGEQLRHGLQRRFFEPLRAAQQKRLARK